MKKFEPKDFEKKWREKWEKEQIYITPEAKKGDETSYILDMYPYPSGSGLHVGHPRGYLGTDIVARFRRMQGRKVLHPMGFDSFGLPAENFAIKSGVHPEKSTNDAIAMFKSQIENIGLSYDWNRELMSHDPEYIKWTQWIFLKLYEAGKAYQKEAAVNWCPTDNTVLANEQVEADGTCERCGSIVVQKNMKQWFFKITDYSDRLITDLEKIDWPQSTKLGQINWIGKKVGINIDYEVVGSDLKVTCFTTTPVNWGATFIVVAPDYQHIQELITDEYRAEANKYIETASKKTELERIKDDKTKTGVFTGSYAVNHVNGEKIPIWISDFVLASVGTGAVQGCPAHDERDFDFAKKFNIPIIRVVKGEKGEDAKFVDPEKESVDQVKIDKGVTRVMVNSDFLNDIPFDEAMSKTMDYFEEKGWGKRVTSYRLRDWLVSRQRFWGCPIPIVYDPEGKAHPVPEQDLPVLLPADVDFKPTGQSPLVDSVAFHQSAEDKYGKGWRRESDTLDTFIDSSWYFFRFTDVNNKDEFASKEKMNAWMPVELYVGGAEHTVLHLMYARFFTKFFFDKGYIDFDEPFQKLRHQGMILAEDNRKMSKRWGNTLDPNTEIEKYGADTLRIYEMFMGPFDSTMPWSTKTEIGVNRFLNKIWDQQVKVDTEYNSLEQDKLVNKLIKKVSEDIESMSFNTAIAKMMEFVNFISKEVKINKSVWEKFLLTLAPFGPFVTEELWSNLGNDFSIHKQPWPKYDANLVADSTVRIGVQINGKTRGDIDIPVDSTESEVLAEARRLQTVNAHIGDKEIRKVIYIKGKILNIVV